MQKLIYFIRGVTFSLCGCVFQTLKPSVHLFPQISKLLKLSRVQEVVFGLALLNSLNSEIRSYAAQFVKQKLPDLLRSYVDAGMSITVNHLITVLTVNLSGWNSTFGFGMMLEHKQFTHLSIG